MRLKPIEPKKNHNRKKYDSHVDWQTECERGNKQTNIQNKKTETEKILSALIMNHAAHAQPADTPLPYGFRQNVYEQKSQMYIAYWEPTCCMHINMMSVPYTQT